MSVTGSQHALFLTACEQFKLARVAFRGLAQQKLVRGNDNHVGDIGEYWVERYYECAGRNPSSAGSKVSTFALELGDGTKVSVRTMTPWARTGKGTPVKPIVGARWELAAVTLDDSFRLTKLAIVPSEQLCKYPPFSKLNGGYLTGSTMGPRSSFPRFQWWPFLKIYEKPLDWMNSLGL